MGSASIILDNISVLVDMLIPLPRGLISFDGCDGAEKRNSHVMSLAHSGEAINLDQFLNRRTGEFFRALRLPELKRQMDGALTRSPIVLLSGVCMREVLASLNRVTVASVYA